MGWVRGSRGGWGGAEGVPACREGGECGNGWIEVDDVFEGDEYAVFGEGIFPFEELPCAVVGVVGDVEDGVPVVDDGSEGVDSEVFGFFEGGSGVLVHGLEFTSKMRVATGRIEGSVDGGAAFW